MKHLLKKMVKKENFTRMVLPILLIIVLALIGYWSLNKPGKKVVILDEAQAKTSAETFINGFLMQGGGKAKVTEISEEYGLYKLKVDITSSIVDSYLTKDGKLFFPQALDVAVVSGTASGTPAAAGSTPAAAAPVASVTNKNSKPVVELFVMSHCPFGTQIEKGMLPVLATLGNKIDFKLKFCSYIMHGEKEITESLLQYCIQKEQPTKLNAYLGCFLLDETQSATCLDKAGIDKTKVSACVASTDAQFKVTENFKNKVGYQGSYPGFDVNKADNTKYGVGGSPTLVINGQEVSSGRDANSLLKSICSAFTTAPKECQTVLSSDSPAPGFGSGTAPASGAAAGCGS